MQSDTFHYKCQQCANNVSVPVVHPNATGSDYTSVDGVPIKLANVLYKSCREHDEVRCPECNARVIFSMSILPRSMKTMSHVMLTVFV